MLAITCSRRLKFPVSSAVATSLMAAASFASSSGVRVLVPFAKFANARCSTGVMASVATGTRALAPSRTSPCDTWSIAPTATGGTPPMVAMALKSSVKFPFSSAVATWLIAAVIFASSSEDRDEPFVMDLNAFCSTGVTASVATGTRALAPSSTCPCDIWSMAPAATGGTPPISAMTLKSCVKSPFTKAVATWLMAAASFASSSGVSMLVPFAMDANARCRTGVMASVATGTSFLAPPSTSPCDTWSIAPTETRGMSPSSAITYINSVKLPSSSAVATSLSAAASFASSSGVSAVVPLVNEANARCRTGVIASVAIGISFFSPSPTCWLDICSIALTATGGTPPSSAMT